MTNVLLAEADRELRDAYVEFLSEQNYHVECAETGIGCVAKLRLSVPDLLILDLELPWGGGDGVLAFLRENRRFMPERIVLTSAPDSAYLFPSLAAPPVIKTLTKPFPVPALLERGPGNRHSRGVLVVDDEPALRELLKLHLANHGFRVWTAGTAEQALDCCCDHGADIAVILLDAQLPGADGPHVLEGIRAFDADIPVCLMSSDPHGWESSDLFARGARHLLRKPFRLESLARIVRNLAMERAEQRTAVAASA